MLETLMTLFVGFVIGTTSGNTESQRVRAIDSVKHSTVSLVASSVDFKWLRTMEVSMIDTMIKSEQLKLASGSGVIITSDGHIMTNKHVVQKGKFFQVRIYGENPTGHFMDHDATLIGVDPNFDMAVLKIEGTYKPARVEMGEVELGESVFAIGTPLGLDGTVTHGIVSTVCRYLPLPNMMNICVVQTDSAINQGNSGGGLFNLDGKLVGINTSIYTTNGGNMGLGFAINAKRLFHLAKQLIEEKI